MQTEKDAHVTRLGGERVDGVEDDMVGGKHWFILWATKVPGTCFF